MSKVGKISGFPEWLPEEKLVEDQIISTIKGIYQSYGFVPIETSAVESLSVLAAKGVIDKELYALKRVRDEGTGEAELGLHFDLSVPMARYVAQNVGSLQFPFKRYQCQKAWRGDRPQKGRFREFYQFDIDIIAQDDLPLSCDAEVLSAFTTALQAINVSPFVIKISNRKVLLGFFEAQGLSPALQNSARIAVDKILKIGPEGVRKELVGTLGLDTAVADTIVAFAEQSFPPAELAKRAAALKVQNATFEAGVKELIDLFALVDDAALANMTVDLSLARGLDYYTGLVCEAIFPKFPEFGSIGGGGRYENLTSQFINRKLPGVGVTIGVTRLMDLIFSNGLLPVTKKSLTQVLVTVYDEAQRKQCNAVATELRKLGVATEVYFKSPKLGKQIDFAASKGIRYVLFLQDGGKLELKDIETKEQRAMESIGDIAALTKG